MENIPIGGEKGREKKEKKKEERRSRKEEESWKLDDDEGCGRKGITRKREDWVAGEEKVLPNQEHAPFLSLAPSSQRVRERERETEGESEVKLFGMGCAKTDSILEEEKVVWHFKHYLFFLSLSLSLFITLSSSLSLLKKCILIRRSKNDKKEKRKRKRKRGECRIFTSICVTRFDPQSTDIFKNILGMFLFWKRMKKVWNEIDWKGWKEREEKVKNEILTKEWLNHRKI